MLTASGSSCGFTRRIFPDTMRPVNDRGVERTILVALHRPVLSRDVVEEHLDELERLVETAGGVVVERFVQERDRPDPATLVGSGFAHRVADSCRDLEVQTVVFDEDLTASQARNLERELPEDVKVLDRAAVILDIFALRARSRESQTQVELAQLSYLLPRLTRRWRHLSRQAGGIGTRGVGETQLEIDRRLIGRRIAQLRAQLGGIERDRRLRRRRRQELPTAALVGYTNAGKSSIFRRLTHARVLVEDRLFATLDPRARRVMLGDGVTAVLVDTVGFIRKLPHDLVAPFRSTLEEATEADVVLHVVDASHPAWPDHLSVGEDVLADLGVESERTVVVMNKIDQLPAGAAVVPPHGRRAVLTSAVSGEGLDELRSTLREAILEGPDVTFVRVPLERSEEVRRAVGLPHQIARRFHHDAVEVAAVVDERRLADLGLAEFRVGEWGSDGGM